LDIIHAIGWLPGQTPPLVYILTRVSYFELFRFCATFAFLASLAMRTAWEEKGRPALPTEIAEKMLRLLPARVTPLAGYMAIVLLCWAGGRTESYLNSLLTAKYSQLLFHHAYRSIPSHGNAFSLFMNSQTDILAVVSLFAGITLLCRWR
jgi:hypothetical protein